MERLGLPRSEVRPEAPLDDLIPRSRAAEVTVKALDRDGKEFTFDADDLLAICVQHELDHLQGKLFVDYLSPLKRKRIQDKLAKIKRYNEKQLSA